MNPKGAEQIAEEVIEAYEVAEIDAAGAVGEPAGRIGESTRTKGSVAEAVVSGAFLWIAQDLIGRVQIRKALMSGRVVRIAIGMVFRRKSSKGGFNLGLVGVTGDAQHFVGAWHDRGGVAWFSLLSTPETKHEYCL
jgi:hypothetical protein